MDGAWVLRSPHVEGHHLAVRSLHGASETLARLVTWTSGEAVEVVDATLLPADIRAISWCSSDASAPNRLVMCSGQDVHMVDLDYRVHPRRVRTTFKTEFSGALGAGVAWAKLGSNVVFARGSSVHAIDAATGARDWSFSVPGASRDIQNNVASLAAVDAHTIVAGWAAEGQEGSGSLHHLDLREPPGPAQKTALAVGVSAVSGLCCSHLEPHLVASYTQPPLGSDTGSHRSEIAIWDLRQRCGCPVARLHGCGEALPLGPLQRQAGLEWSPSKSGTLLAVVAGGGPSGCVWDCRLWSLEEGEVQVSGTQRPARWLGEARPMRCTRNEGSGGHACNVAADLVAAGWAHPSQPGLALALRNGGALVPLEQRVAQVPAWCPKGGGLTSRPWQRRDEVRKLGFPPHNAGAPAVLEASNQMANLDACCMMRDRAEHGEYGVAKVGYDEYSRIARCIGGCTPGNEALAAMWQWVKLADGLSDHEADPDGPHTASMPFWKGVQAILNDEDAASDEHTTELARGIRGYTSEGRRLALQALGFPQHEPMQTLPAADGPSPAHRTQVEETVRRILRSVCWLQLERAAADCELLEPLCGLAARPLVPQLILVFHVAACLLGASGTGGSASHSAASSPARPAMHRDRGEEPTGRVRIACEPIAPPAKAFHAALRGALASTAWQHFPGSASLRLTLRFLEAVVAATQLAEETESAVEAKPAAAAAPAETEAESRSAGRGAAAVEEAVQTLITWSQPGTLATSAIPSERSHRDGSKASAAGLPAVPAVALSAHVAGTSRPSVPFRCALALLFLPQAVLESALDALHVECTRMGFLDGLCLTGLGGADAALPFQPSDLEALAIDTGPPPPVSAPLHSSTPMSLRRTQTAPMSTLQTRAVRTSSLASQQDLGSLDEGAGLVLAYVARTGDVQSAALLFCHALHLPKPPVGLQRCFAQYAALLARWRLHRQRANLHNLVVARLAWPEEGLPREAGRPRGPVVFCGSCMSALTGLEKPGDDPILRRCPNMACSKAAPSCAVCLLPIFVIRPEAPTAKSSAPVRLAMDNWVAWCQACHHGGHMVHLEQWFEAHAECPVAGCDCHCGSLY